MKRFFFTLLIFIFLPRSSPVYADKVLYVTDAGDTTTLAVLTQPQVHALKHDLLDIGKWIRNAILGKMETCKGRLISEGMEKLKSDPDVTEIPVKEDDLIELIVNRPDYKDRAEKEAESNP